MQAWVALANHHRVLYGRHPMNTDLREFAQSYTEHLDLLILYGGRHAE
jgi:hypothetical protein